MRSARRIPGCLRQGVLQGGRDRLDQAGRDRNQPLGHLELEAEGAVSARTRERLMRKAFHHTADYDAMIATALDDRWGEVSLRLAFAGGRPLRYGENAHQQAVFLRGTEAGSSLYDMEVLGGKALSYNNIVDLYAALDAVRDLPRQGCAVIKHTNPCGLCDAVLQRTALERAWEGDPVSAFGSVIAFNRTVERRAVEFLRLDAAESAERKFVEVVVAPDFEPEAVAYLTQREALRVVRFDPRALPEGRELKILGNAALLQDADRSLYDALSVMTKTRPAEPIEEDGALRRLIEFGIVAVRQVKSNAIVLVAEAGEAIRLLGMGAGQPNRVVATGLAVERARETLRAEGKDDTQIREALGRAVLVSGAFFPFPDSVEIAAAAGVRTIVQPGGSIRDEIVVSRADELGVAMISTGMRHFKH